jgi:hypothetical protein
MFKVIDSTTNEAIGLKSTTDRYGQKRIFVVSDNPDKREAGNETFKTKDVFKKYGAAWDNDEKHWYWNDRFKSADEIAKMANDAVKTANQILGADISGRPEVTKFDDVESLVKAKEFLETVKGTLEFVKSKSGKVTLDLINDYIDQLADSLDDQKLLDDIAEFNKAAKAYILDTGRYSYSFFNTFMIWLQATKGAKEFGSVPYWLGRGYEPKPDARKIMILKPGGTGSLASNVARIIKDHPKSPQEYAAESGTFKITDPNNPIPKEKHNAFWNWALKKGYVKFKGTSQFTEVAIYDNANVQPIPGVEQINAPEPPKWYNDDDTEDEKSRVMIEALKAFSEDNGIRIKQSDDLGGARGVSKGGHIELLTNSVGAGLLSTFVHELAHEILHQPANKGLANGKLFIGREFSSEEKELHAEAVAYTVMKTYEFPIEHSINYLALWKQNKDKVKAFQKVIRETSMFIIQQIEKYAPNVEGGATPGETNVAESLNEIKSIINRFKELITY